MDEQCTVFLCRGCCCGTSRKHPHHDHATQLHRLHEHIGHRARGLGELLATKGVDIFRSKGILALAGQTNQYVFQGVHMLLDGDDGRPWRDGEPRTNRLVFIGRNLDRTELESAFAACLTGAGA